MDLGNFMHFRCHTDELDINDLLAYLNEKTDIQFAVKEYGKSNREHIHAVLKLKVSDTCFRDNLKKRFPVINGNKYYGLQTLKKSYEHNARYCYKGVANDYPDILQTVHTEQQWKQYYTDYWEEYKKLHPVVDTNLVLKAKSEKVKTKTFMEKLNEKIYDEYPALPNALWRHYGYKTDVLCPPSLDELEKCQDYLADYLLLNLGKARKNIDDLIFERLYKNLYYGILSDCPQNLLKKTAIEKLGKFRKNL